MGVVLHLHLVGIQSTLQTCTLWPQWWSWQCIKNLDTTYMWQIEGCATLSIHLYAEQNARQMHAQFMPTYKIHFFYTHSLHIQYTHNHKKQMKWYRESLSKKSKQEWDQPMHTRQTCIDKSSMLWYICRQVCSRCKLWREQRTPQT